MSSFKGIIIEESLSDKSVLKDVEIIETEIELVTLRHQTPWLKQWTLHTVQISDERAEVVAEKVSRSLDRSHSSWYADFKNKDYHYIIFPDNVFKVDRKKAEGYREATEYGISIGIPEYQVDFSPEVVV